MRRKIILNNKKQKVFDVILVCSFFILYLIWSIHLPTNKGPDETMRYDIPKWIVQNAKLPIGNESELIHPMWGISYGFTPYLPSLIAVCFMNLATLVGNQADVLFFAARLTSVFAGTITVFFSLLIGKESFERLESKYLFAILVGLLPQFGFLCAYFNNDAFSVMSCTMIIYAWILGIKNNWSWKSCIILAIGLAFCTLTYYNAYGYILCSILLCCVTLYYYRNCEKDKKEFISKIIFVFIVVCLLAGWYFIRNYIIYNGDILGIHASRQCAELNAMSEYKPSLHSTYKKMGKSIFDMLSDEAWVKWTINSFFACFGYMEIWADGWIYICYYFVIGIGFLWCLLNFKNQKTNKRFLGYILIVSIIIPIFLSCYNSYATDYQPQGRYIMPGMPALMLLVSSGYECIANKICIKRNWVELCVIFIWSFLFVVVFCTTVLKCWSNIFY